MKTNKFYLTTPIYYTSGSPHLGHLYTTVAADIISRYKKMQNFEVLFSTGSDENSLKVLKAAEKAHKEPKEFVDAGTLLSQVFCFL
jgi:methionyl-tRNA synthetase